MQQADRSPAGCQHPSLRPPKFVEFSEQDIDAALASLEETFDISREDISRLLRQLEIESLTRLTGKAPLTSKKYGTFCPATNL